jgi:two-component system, NtrC family, sensor histidine kinase HydH
LGGRARLVHRLRPKRRQEGPPPDDATRARRRFPRVVYEFEPLAAIDLQRQSRDLLILASLCGLAVVGLAAALSRSLRQRDVMREELESGRRLAALGSMSAVLAHELRNPLASLKGHAQLLGETVEADAKLAPKVQRIISESVRLERLLDDLLTFVKSGELRRAPADPNMVLRGAVQAAGEDAIEARYLPTVARASLDAERLQQALENVLRNAVQASPAGIKVVAEISQQDGSLHFAVRDSGSGITAGEEERIFEPFVTGRVQGVGLGLAITRRIVELHGGSVTARNRSEGGAELLIQIPREEA